MYNKTHLRRLEYKANTYLIQNELGLLEHELTERERLIIQALSSDNPRKSLPSSLKHSNFILNEAVKWYCNYTNTDINELMMKTRKQKIVDKRKELFWIIRYTHKNDISLPKIAKKFKMDHTNILHHIKDAENIMDVDKNFFLRMKVMQRDYNEKISK